MLYMIVMAAVVDYVHQISSFCRPYYWPRQLTSDFLWMHDVISSRMRVFDGTYLHSELQYLSVPESKRVKPSVKTFKLGTDEATADRFQYT